jgi:hypothetical protein
MSARPLLPDTYAAWRRCIEVDCGLELTPDFIRTRLDSLSCDRDPHTRRFVAQWGEEHRKRVLGWLEKARF